jgi:uncharacterized protein YcbX
MRIEHLYRYPVKGLTAEALEEAPLEQGRVFPWDRAFALAQGDAPFDPAHPVWLRKKNFMCLAFNARAAALRTNFDPATGALTMRTPDGAVLTEDALSEDGRERIGTFLTGFLDGEARGTPRFHHVPGHVFSDVAQPFISLISQTSLADLERRAGGQRHRLRFRANIYFSGAAPWSELDWIGHDIQIGRARLRVMKRISRCPATEVNPDTADRDCNPVKELRDAYGHVDMGVYAEVVDGGTIAVGDAIEVLPD